MKTKVAVAILLIAIFALSSITIMQIKPTKASAGSSSTLTLSDAELMLAEFAEEWGPGTLTGKTLIAPGVQFDFTGLQLGADTGVGDNFVVNAMAGGAIKDYGYGFSGPYDFSGYKRFCLCVENIGTEVVTVALMMNTGWTVDWSGGQWKGLDGFGASPARDTFWRSGWVTLDPGECKVVCLDFSSATCYHAWDDPVAAWQHPDGTGGVPVQRLDEVSNIGLTVLGNDVGSIIVKGTQLYIDPPVVNETPSDVGSTFNVFVTLENFANLAGFDIKLTWNSAMITETGIDTSYLNALWGPQGTGWQVAYETSGAGFHELVVVALATSASNAGACVLFEMTFHVDRSCNFPLQTPIHFEVASLSDNTVPVPKTICAVVTDGMYNISGTQPDIEFKVKEWNKKTSTWDPVSPPYEFHYCNTFEVEIYVTHICVCSCLTDYHLKIAYDPTLVHFTDVDTWGVFGTGTVGGAAGLIEVSGEGNPWSGSEGMLFALTFHVEFACTPDHIWKYGNANNMTFPISIADAQLSFGNTLALSDAELGTQFAEEVGPGTLTKITQLPGTGVQFDFVGLDSSAGTVVGNNFPVNALAGGAIKDYGYGFSGPYDFSGYKRYCLCICDVSPLYPVTVALMMNTGWTVDWSGGKWVGPDGFGASPARDTFWRSGWVTLNPGECKVVCLDFSSATCYHAWDDPVAAWQHPDGTAGVPVQRLDEVSNIGIEVLASSGSPGQIAVKGCPGRTIGMSEISMPSPLTIQVDFIRGDVDCNGVVNLADISDVAYYYGQPASAKPEYDLTNDGVINLYDLVTVATNYGYGMDP